MVFQQTQLFFSMACYIDYFSLFLLCQNSLIWYRLSFTKEAGMPSTMNLLEEDLDDDEEPLNPMAEVCIRISPTFSVHFVAYQQVFWISAYKFDLRTELSTLNLSSGK